MLHSKCLLTPWQQILDLNGNVCYTMRKLTSQKVLLHYSHYAAKIVFLPFFSSDKTAYFSSSLGSVIAPLKSNIKCYDNSLRSPRQK
jgi:hypothetical protein